MQPIEMRSWGRFSISDTKPEPSAPRRFSFGTRTSVKDSSAVSWACSPILARLRPRSKPSMPRSTTSSEMPWCPASGSVRQTTTTRSDRIPLEMKVFDPLST